MMLKPLLAARERAGLNHLPFVTRISLGTRTLTLEVGPINGLPLSTVMARDIREH